jgi:hypothetical protein
MHIQNTTWCERFQDLLKSLIITVSEQWLIDTNLNINLSFIRLRWARKEILALVQFPIYCVCVLF